jgi:dihydropteroate synthase
MSANVEALKRHYEATNRRDWAGALEVMHPDIEWDTREWVDGGLFRGLAEVAEATRSVLGAFREQTYELLRTTEVGPHVVVRVRLSGLAKADELPVEMDMGVVWSMRGGQAVRMKWFPSEARALEFARSPAARLPLVRPTLMGVVNVTPDSFSDGGLFLEADAAIEHGKRLATEGAGILDIGGESTRPGAEPVSEEAELRRVAPVVQGLAGGEARISIDTSKPAVARSALDVGASIVNDVTAFRAAPELAGLVADSGADCCLMHMLGEPRTMQEDPRYEDVVSDVKAFLEERLAFAASEGVPEERVWLDPGIGFGKTVEHNLELLRRLDEIVAIGRPVVVGTSRKSFLGKLTGGRGESERLPGTIATNVIALERGATVFRVHDVAEVADALTVAAATVGTGR